MIRTMTAVISVFAVAASAFGAVRVPLSVTEPVGTARNGEPISVGVPLAKGVATDTSRLRVQTAEGTAVPAQFRVLNRYWKGVSGPKDAWFCNGDGSVKWVLIDFQASVAARGTAKFVLTDAGLAALKSTLTVTDDAGQITVDTGVLQFAVSKRRFRMFESVTLGGKPVFKAAAGDGFVVVGMDGKRYSSGTDAMGALKVSVAESGPVKVVIVAEGVLKAGNNAGGYDLVGSNGKGTVHVPGRDGEKLGYTIRIVAYAGRPFVRVFHTVRALGKTTATRNDMDVKPWAYAVGSPRRAGNFFVKSAVLESTFAGQGPLQYTFGGDLLATQYGDDEYGAGHATDPVTGAVKGDAGAALFQASSAGWTWQVAENKVFDPGLKSNIAYMKSKGHSKAYFEFTPRYHEILKNVYGCPFMGYEVTAAGKQKAQANRAAGWMDVSDGTVGVAVSVRDFWQMYPKSLEVAGTGRITVGLWPKQWKRGHLFEGRIHRTHELLYYFHEGGAKAADVAGQMRAFRAPLMAVMPPKYVVGTGVLGNAVVADAKKYPAYEARARTAVYAGLNPALNLSYDSSMDVEHEKYDEFGVFDFGDSSKGGWKPDGHGTRHWGQFQEFDGTWVLMMNFYRGGDRRFLDVARTTAGFLMGIPAHGGGYGHQYPESSHSYETGMLFHHYTTGSPEIREAMDHMADYRWKNGTLNGYNNKPNTWRYNGRNAAWQIHGMIALFDLTGDKKWLDHAEYGFGVLEKRLSPSGTFGTRSSYQLGTFLAACGRYWEFTGSENAKRLHLKVIDYFARKNGKGDWYSPWMINAYAHAYRMTNDAKFLDLAKGAYGRVFRGPATGEKGQKFRTGTASVKTWSNSTRNAQPLLWLLEQE